MTNKNVRIRNNTEYTFPELAGYISEYLKLCNIGCEYTKRLDEGWICIDSHFSCGYVYIIISYTQ